MICIIKVFIRILIVEDVYMVIRILFLLFSLLILVNLCILTVCYITGTNLYEKYSKQILIISGVFVLLVAAIYVALSLIGLN